MVRIIGCITELHDLRLVFVAFCLCAIGSWTTVALLSRARNAQARLQTLWICVSAFVFGLSVWATHFVAMLAFRTPFPVSYDIAWTALSIALAVGLSGIGFAVAVKTPWQATGGVLVGGAIGAMHYVGMKAMEGPFRIDWDAHYVVASLLTGAAMAGIALQSRQFTPPAYAEPVKALLLCLGICALHFIGMSAITIIPDPTIAEVTAVIAPGAIAIAVSAVALLIVALVENQARNADVGLGMECQRGLPHLWADDRRTKQIVLNLLSNAIKFTSPGGSVKVTAALQDGAIAIAVADTGIGIAEANLPKAFESFGQIDSRLSRKYDGSGLGLPLARHLAALHGGTLTIESQLHVGTVVTLRFPAQRTQVVTQALSA